VGASVIPSSAFVVAKEKAQESVSVAVLQAEASRIALSMSDGNAEAHAYMQLIHAGGISHEILSECMKLHTTGIYRCSIPDIDMKFCENFCLSRISADKRFQKLSLPTHPLQTPRPGLLLRSVCVGKGTTKFR